MRVVRALGWLPWSTRRDRVAHSTVCLLVISLAAPYAGFARSSVSRARRTSNIRCRRCAIHLFLRPPGHPQQKHDDDTSEWTASAVLSLLRAAALVANRVRHALV